MKNDEHVKEITIKRAKEDMTVVKTRNANLLHISFLTYTHFTPQSIHVYMKQTGNSLRIFDWFFVSSRIRNHMPSKVMARNTKNTSFQNVNALSQFQLGKWMKQILLTHF